MKWNYRRQCREAALFALAFTCVVGGLPLIAARSAIFLGKDMSTLAAGVVSFYPMAAVAEVSRVLGAAFVIAFLATFPFVTLKEQVARWRLIVCPGMPLAAYSLWWAGAALSYPALYESILPVAVQRLVFRTAGFVGPQVFYGLALSLYILPLAAWAIVAWRPGKFASRKSRLLAVPFVVVVVLAGLWTAFPRVRAGSSNARPNILFLAVDSLRLDRSLDESVAPNLVSFAADPLTVSFLDHYVGIPRTFPSWVEILEGRYAARTGIRHMFPGFGERSGEKSGIATVLRDSGYSTSIHSDFAGDIFPRFSAGFEVVDAPKLTLTSMIRLSVDQTFSGFLPIVTTGPLRHLFPAMKQSPAFGDPGYLAEQVLDRLNTAPSGRPWFVAAFFSTAHFPYAAPYPYYRFRADTSYDGPFRFQKNPEMGTGDGKVRAEDIAQVRALYDGALRAVDDELGKIFADLKRQGLWDSTVIVVTADHGEDLYENGNLQGHGEHLRGENVLKVPLLIKLPASLRPNIKRFDYISRSIDVASTVAAMSGADKQVGDGLNLLPWLVGAKRGDPEQAAYAETGLWFARTGSGFYQQKRLDYPGITGLLSFDQGYSGEIVLNPNYEKLVVAAKHRALIVGDWKLIYMPTPVGIEYELYDRRKDPANLHNLASTEVARLDSMKERLFALVVQLEGKKAHLADGFVVPK